MSLTTTNSGFPRPELIQDVARDLEEMLGQRTSLREETRRDLERVVATIWNYVEPRLIDGGLPVNVAFAGPTGGGKSTLLNSTIGRVVSRSGPIRPTTIRPLVVAAEKDSAARSLGALEVATEVAQGPLFTRVALIDTPDIDSTRLENRRLADEVLAAADVVVFVVSAIRYADLAAIEVLESLVERDVAVIPVLNRMSAETSGAMVDFRRLLRSRGVTEQMVTVAEHRIPVDGLLPASAIKQLVRQIALSVAEETRRSRLEKTIESLRTELSAVAYELNADLMRGGNATVLSPAEITPSGYDPAFLADDWRKRLRKARAPWRRVLHPEGANGMLKKLSFEIRSEFVVLVERDLRMFVVERGGLTVDLSDGPGPSGRLDLIDDTIADWFYDLDRDGSGSAGSLVRKVRAAIEAFEAFTGVPDSRSEHADGLRRVLEGLYRRVGASLEDEKEPARVLDTIQRARARLRTEPSFVDV